MAPPWKPPSKDLEAEPIGFEMSSPESVQVGAREIQKTDAPTGDGNGWFMISEGFPEKRGCVHGDFYWKV